MASSTKIISKNYEKRPGTSGIQGHLYETKLLSLIYFRALHNDDIQEFHLATNVDKLGSFDDICFRVKGKGIEKPLTVFIQAKHRENNAVLTLNSKSDLIKHFNSYLEIRNKFKPNNKDVLFDGVFGDTECLFVIYTTAKSDESVRKYIRDNTTFLNTLIGTEVLGSNLQPLDDSKHAELNQILLEEEMTALAQVMAKCMHGELKDVQMLNQEDVVLRYHAILAQKSFDVSDEQSKGLRDVCFRQDFFDINEEILRLFKEKLCTEILKRRKFLSDTSSRLPDYLASCDITDIKNEYQEIKHLITYENRKFEFIDKIGSVRYKPFLDKINESQDTIQETLELAVKQSLPSLMFKVPAWFGNKDLTIRGDDKKIERKLMDLTSKIIRLIENSGPNNIVIIDESLGEGFLQLSGGIASAVGNLLVFDDVSKLLKFNDNRKSLGMLAEKLFDHLNCKIENLYEYRFDVRVKIFPKLSFNVDECTKNVVRDFSKKLLFYTSQAKEAKVETILINEIENHLRHRDDIYNDIKCISNTIFVKYHEAIQKWWMKQEGKYLTKEKSLYENAEQDTLNQPLTSLLNMMQRVKTKKYAFTEDAVNSLKLDKQPSGTVILTKNITLTVAKLLNHLIKKDCVVLDMQYLIGLSTNDTETLQKELIDFNKKTILIISWDISKSTLKYHEKKIANLTNSLRSKTVKFIILDDQNLIKNVKKYFKIDTTIKDERNNLIDMNKDSQKTILENTNVIFHGVEVGLNQVLDDKSLGLVEEYVLNELMQSDTYTIGKQVSHLNDKNKIYIERSVKCLKVLTGTIDANDKKIEEGKIKKISTLHDLEDDNIVPIIGDSGMGKSSLLTQLSLKTKQTKPTDWILRINLLDYSGQFYNWQNNKTVINTLKSLKFLCQATLSKNPNERVKITLKDNDGTVFLKDIESDEWIRECTIFELKLFLHYYNTKQLIILFDGFDEICLTYASEAFSLIKAVMNFHRKHKIWITSRSYKVITELNLKFFYKLEPLNIDEQNSYLSAFWKEMNLLKKINRRRIRNNLSDFCNFMTNTRLHNSNDLNVLKKKVHLSDQSINQKPMLAIYMSLFKYLKPTDEHLDSIDLYKELTFGFGGLVANPLHLNMLAKHLYNQIDVKGADDDDDDDDDNDDDDVRHHRNHCRKFADDDDDDEDDDDDDHNDHDDHDDDDYKRNVRDSESKKFLEHDDEEKAKLKLWNYMLTMYDFDGTCTIDNHLPIQWDLDVHLFEIYERFLEYKLKIRFHEKNRINLYTPDNSEYFMRKYAYAKQCLTKLAAYVVYNKQFIYELKCLYHLSFMDCETIIENLKYGKQNTDICNVVNNIPIFVHSTFSEYFAIEYICQLIQKLHYRGKNLTIIYNFILNVMFFEHSKYLLVLLDEKIVLDEKLRSIIDEDKNIIFELLLDQNKLVENEHGGIRSSLCEAIRLDLRNFADLLLSTTYTIMDDLQLTNLVNIVRISNMLMIAVKMGFDELLIRLINNIRRIDESKLNLLFKNIEIFDKNVNFERETTESLVQKLHANVWTHMGINPDGKNLVDLCGHIHFI